MRYLTALLVASLLFITGCDSDSNDKDSDSVSEFDLNLESSNEDGESTYDSAKKHGLSDSKVEELFAAQLQTEHPAAFAALSRSELIELGTGVCDMFDLDQSFMDIVDMGIEAGYATDEISYLIGTSVAAFCPEHSELE